MVRKDERLLVLASATEAASLPEENDRERFFVVQFVGESEYEIEVADRCVNFLFDHGEHAVRHAQIEEIVEREIGTRRGVEAMQHSFQSGGIEGTHINPL